MLKSLQYILSQNKICTYSLKHWFPNNIEDSDGCDEDAVWSAGLQPAHFLCVDTTCGVCLLILDPQCLHI